MRGRLLLILAVAVTVAAVAAALLTVGGPMAARRLALDERRFDMLVDVANALHCKNWRVLNLELPETLTLAALREHCGSVGLGEADLLDPVTGKPFIYTRLDGGDGFRVCAEFNDAMALQGRVPANALYRDGAQMSSFDPETGCVTGRVR